MKWKLVTLKHEEKQWNYKTHLNIFENTQQVNDSGASE